MLSVNIDSKDLFMQDIKKRDFSTLIKWYQDSVHYRHATGFHRSFTMDDLTNKYEEWISSKDKFCLGIYLKPYFNIIGLISGTLNLENNNTLWITSMMIDLSCRRRGYGSKCIDMLIGYFRLKYEIQKIYISVSLENIEGLMFWHKSGFKKVAHIKSDRLFNNITNSIMIMEKNLT